MGHGTVHHPGLAENRTASCVRPSLTAQRPYTLWVWVFFVYLLLFCMFGCFVGNNVYTAMHTVHA